MTDNNRLLQQIRKVVREEVKAETEPINKRLDTLEQGQTQTNTTLGQLTTAVEATAAGVKEFYKKQEQ